MESHQALRRDSSVRPRKRPAASMKCQAYGLAEIFDELEAPQISKVLASRVCGCAHLGMQTGSLAWSEHSGSWQAGGAGWAMEAPSDLEKVLDCRESESLARSSRRCLRGLAPVSLSSLAAWPVAMLALVELLEAEVREMSSLWLACDAWMLVIRQVAHCWRLRLPWTRLFDAMTA